MRFIIFGLIGFIFFNGCAQKVRIKALQPAQISRASQTKKIAITKFKSDSVGLSNKIEAKIASYRLDGKKYFTVVSRKDLNKILKEQKFQSSGLIEQSTAIEAGNLIGAKAIISGRVIKPSLSDSYYYELRTKCSNKKCWEVKVSCKKRIVGLSAQIRMVDIQNGDIIYADTINKESIWTHCSDDSSVLPSKTIASQYLADEIADNFVYKLMPHYVYFNVTLLEDPDLKYSDMQKRLLRNSLKYIEQNRLTKASELLIRLIDSTAEKSYVAIYNLGVIREAQGNYKEAKELYAKADSLTIEPVKELNIALNRINRVIKQNNEALKQIKR